MRGPSPELRVIFSEEFRQQLRRLGLLIFTVLITAMLVITIPVTSFIVDLMEDDGSEDTSPADSFLKSVGYVDLAGVLPATPEQDWPKFYEGRQDGIEAVRQNEIDTLFILKADYMESGIVEEYELAGKGRNLGGSPDEWDFESFLRYKLAEGELDTNLLSRVTDPASYRRFEVEAGGCVSGEISTAVEAGEIIVPILFAALLMIAVLSGSGALLRTVYEEKETRMVEMLITSASPLSLMAGKLLALWTTGLIQTAVWITVGAFTIPAAFDRIPGGGDLTISSGLLAIIILSFILGYFLFSVLAMFIATVANSQQSAQQYIGLLSVLVGLPIYMTGLWLNMPDHIIAQVLTYFPFSAPTMLMVRDATGAEMSSGEIAASLALVAVTAFLCLWITARIYRAGILLSGQQIRPRTVWTALRNAD